ncbi:uncharacterized protein [Vicugna pacos]|uniref:Uncharacterized protein n=1 Tax=Vicugna pacos TaxID=30538 RepID=A0ABM5CNY9_VICPA
MVVSPDTWVRVLAQPEGGKPDGKAESAHSEGSGSTGAAEPGSLGSPGDSVAGGWGRLLGPRLLAWERGQPSDVWSVSVCVCMSVRGSLPEIGRAHGDAQAIQGDAEGPGSLTIAILSLDPFWGPDVHKILTARLTLWWTWLGALGPALLLTSLLDAWAGLGPGQGEQAVMVAVVFGSLGPLQGQAHTRLIPQSFLDLLLEIQPLTVGVNTTNPSSLLTQIYGLLGAARVHGIVSEGNVGTEAVAQIQDFISSQPLVPILSISGGSAVVLTPKVPVQNHVPSSLEPGWGWGSGAESGPGRHSGPGKLGLGGISKEVGAQGDMGEGGEGCGDDVPML